ncbi:MAG: family 10 glycosylhydrolase, partial [Clostridia bacterium]|nr:family 10 glycosylhydrolase [Clostridia bacterium]
KKFWEGKAVYYDGIEKHQTYQNEFEAYTATIMKNIKNSGFNTVIVQLHPDCDSMYPSALYPWSDYMLGEYGSISSYDLLQILLDAAHAEGLSFHAWINPMRCMNIDDIKKVNVTYPIRQWFDDPEKNGTYIFQYSKGLYLNPAYEEVRKYIADVAAEIVRYYDVDAIHMDDYFYPNNTPTYDKAAFEAQTAIADKGEFRRNNVSQMVKDIYDAVKRENPNVLFGISPRGNVEQCKNDLAADVEKWVSEDGYIDYIIPQIYFGFLHNTSAFDKFTQRWIEITTAETVDLYIGLGIYKQNKTDTYAGTVDDAKYEWEENDDIAKRQLEYLRTCENVDGFCMFSYEYIFNMLTGEYNPTNKAETELFLPEIAASFN